MTTMLPSTWFFNLQFKLFTVVCDEGDDVKKRSLDFYFVSVSLEIKNKSKEKETKNTISYIKSNFGFRSTKL